MSHVEKPDSSERLSEEESNELRRLLYYLRHVMRHQYKVIAKEISCPVEDLWDISSRRSRGTIKQRDRVEEYAKRNGVPIQLATGIGAHHGFRSHLGLSDEILTKEANRLAGRYLSFTLLPGKGEYEVGITLLGLDTKDEGDALPEFRAWRPAHNSSGSAVRQQGLYFTMHDGALSLIGHEEQTGYLRLLNLEPRGDRDERVFFGTVSASSKNYLSFQSWCYIRPTQDKILDLARGRALGVFRLQEIQATHPRAYAALADKSIQTIERFTSPLA